MGGFTVDKLGSLDFDFTEIPHKSGDGFCSGQGVIPEPTESRIKAYFDAVGKIRARTAEALKDKSGKKLAALEEKSDEMQAELCQIISALGDGTPSEAQLAQLPPRALRVFFDWITSELTDPKG